MIQFPTKPMKPSTCAMKKPPRYGHPPLSLRPDQSHTWFATALDIRSMKTTTMAYASDYASSPHQMRR
jgi:hypothetical protein